MSWQALKDSLGVTLRPLQSKEWLKGGRGSSPFSASLKDTLGMLKTELRELSAKDIVFEIDIREQDLRLDGLPRANAIAQTPAVALSFQSKHGPLRIAFDRFVKWEHNLRAIAMHLNHLRMAGLYGVGSSGEQYRGWQALPPGASVSSPSNDDPDADIRLLLAAAGMGVSPAHMATMRVESAFYKTVRRSAQVKSHPDNGGTHEIFVKVSAAVERLDKRFDK